MKAYKTVSSEWESILTTRVIVDSNIVAPVEPVELVKESQGYVVRVGWIDNAMEIVLEREADGRYFFNEVMKLDVLTEEALQKLGFRRT